ncbi:1-deoxy-D-xylulose-5-phosphate reductoisomerase [Roseospira marina]|uniref:1-deoxy-D-xylulose 5-phosphate reductoisomerase n=1 Tax=Roseospira marina TaxID=140057 RepID=A0A5M6I8E9_9PROT|nr:1-deoxy-D-xylulose-5-phosphate reductoisomerase [Roseospira marina]KAA5604481.1 1-deoxy-D-xylulose-5-phosphate reductoisomerase [Roseospira marina]MBB4315530.1 1-deoxy-D-xylulose-5-phosphate reductoisomerase [Roseospira marina]MBB5088533.1 1-deoxy-D-xylulose-5-phosphate reductoisomerase [Roseospira marina]
MGRTTAPLGDAESGAPRTVTVLGSTGSIGTNTLDLIGRNPGRYQVEALTANSNVETLAAQARAFNARLAVVADPAHYGALKEALAGTDTEVAAGPQALKDAAARPAEWVMAAIVGAAGLEPTLEAVNRGATIALANKECLVCAGELFMTAVSDKGATFLPVDSEHNAIFQVFDFEQRSRVDRIILTASGGPFRTWTREQMVAVTPEQAVAHPNWSMGAKISVDSATMMNKGLEFIEAHHIFAMPVDRIDILVHPQSVIHSMVSYVDGSVLAQLGTPDMRTPIAFTLGWPRRMEAPTARLDLGTIGTLQFEAPDETRFPALRLVREALKAGGAAPTILNAANEVAVAAFLARRIAFLDIAALVERSLERVPHAAPTSLEDVLAIDRDARAVCADLIQAAAA